MQIKLLILGLITLVPSVQAGDDSRGRSGRPKRTVNSVFASVGRSVIGCHDMCARLTTEDQGLLDELDGMMAAQSKLYGIEVSEPDVTKLSLCYSTKKGAEEFVVNMSLHTVHPVYATDGTKAGLKTYAAFVAHTITKP